MRALACGQTNIPISSRDRPPKIVSTVYDDNKLRPIIDSFSFECESKGKIPDDATLPSFRLNTDAWFLTTSQLPLLPIITGI